MVKNLFGGIKKTMTLAFLIALVFILSTSSSIAQSYNLKSLDGEPVKITLYYKPFSGILSITGAGEKFYINDYNGVLEAEIIKGHFLKILYSARGGTNSIVNNLLILCVSKKKMFQAFHENVYSGGENVDTYELAAHLINTNPCKLRLEMSRVTYTPVGSTSKRHEKKDSALLVFDPINNCFRNTEVNFDKTYLVYDPKVGKQVNRVISGKFPGFIVGGDLSSIIDYEWYSVNLKNRTLYKYSYK
jgi:hypothetical protein